MGRRPDIPKRLASRIRAAQERVRQKRLSIVASEYNYDQTSRRMAEFDDDPSAFAERYYGRHGVDSYPVQTHVSRNRERMTYHEGRVEGRLRELAALELELLTVEEQVLIEVQKMRPTAGRVPWPRRLSKFSKYQAEFESQMQREDEQARIDRAADDAELARLIAEDEAKNQAESDREDVRFVCHLASLNPQEYARYRAWADHFANGIRSGTMRMTDILERLRQGRN